MAQATQSVLEFDGQNDFVELPGKSIPSGSEITVSFWSYGGSLSPKHSSIIGAQGPNNERILNIHLPWGESKIYFDSGNQASGFDRIEKLAQASEYKQKWSHWAFTKNVTTGEMKIYLNGELWHSGTGKTMPLIPATRVTLGCFSNSQLYHHGMISELQIWNKARSQDEIKADMARRLVGNEPGLVGYWPLNEGAGTTVKDKTNNANHGTISGNAAWVQAELPIEVKQQPAPPKLQPVLSFDGQNDYINCPEGIVTNSYTKEAWVKLAEPLSQHNNILSGRNHALFMPNGLLGSGHNGQWWFVKDSSTSPANTWFHVAVTYDSQTKVMCLYRDGRLVSQASDVQPFDPSDRTLQIGSHNSSFLFKGQIAEARVWNKVLSQTEIQSNLSHRLVGNEPGLVVYWPLNEGTGTTVQDKTNNANHGNISGNAAWVQAEIPIEVKQPPTPSKLQPVLSLDGQDDYVELPGKSIPSGSEITVSFWSNAGTLQPKYSSIIEARSDNNTRLFNIHLPWQNSIIYFDCGDLTGYDRITKTMPVSDYRNKWLHWAFTKNATTGEMKIYVNGELWHSESNKTKPISPAAKVCLGCYTDLQNYHHGMISELQIWNKARSQDEIKADMAYRLVGNEPGLVGYWPLNEGTGTTVQDKTKNANHGTISGNAAWLQAEIPIEVKQPQPPTAPQEQPQPDPQPETPVVTQEQSQPDPQPETPVVTQEQSQPDPQPETPVVTQEQPQPNPQPDIQGQPLVIIQEHSESAIVKQPQTQQKKRTYPYRILSIDGGGIRGIIPAMILAEIERRTEKPISSMFDLFAGTSTGGILALGLTKPKPNPNAPAYSEGVPEPAYSAQALVSMFAKYGSEIFYEPIIEELLGNLDDIIKPKYTSEGREDVLKRFFDFTPLQETLKEVFITSYDIELRTPVFFTSNPKKQNTQSHSYRRICRGFTMKQAAMATSAAPTYFSPYRIQTSQSPSSFYNLVDGGVFANNPTSLALMEALNNAKAAAKRGEETWTIDDILVVSLGTGSLTKVYPYNEARNWGLIGWVRPLINIILDATSQSVSCELEQLLRAPDNSQKQYYRFQAYLDERLEPMDNAKAENIRMLTRVAKQIIDEREEDIDELCNELMR